MILQLVYIVKSNTNVVTNRNKDATQATTTTNKISKNQMWTPNMNHVMKDDTSIWAIVL